MQVTSNSRSFSYNPQDRAVMPATTTTLAGVQEDASTDKLKISGGLKPNAEGDFVYAPDQPGFHAANAFAGAYKVLHAFEAAYGSPIKWSTGKAQLEIHPDEGQMLNAYYDRRRGGLFFFHAVDPVNKKVVYSADSGEVTGHECAHAVLDAVRPKYMNSWSPDPGGFHESFGDVMALFTTLQEPAVLDKVLEQTGGDLSKPNISAALGEEMGIIINHTAGKNATGGDYTRNAINNFVWQDPSSLPQNAPPDQLSSEPHSWSRLWTGAVYDLLQALVADNLARQGQNKNPRQALIEAAQEGLQMYGRLMRKAPQAGFTYQQMATAFIRSDQEFNAGKRAELIARIFTERKILQRHDEPLPQGSRTVTVSLEGARFGPFAGATVSEELSGQEPGDTRAGVALQDQMLALIQAGAILHTTPGQVLTDKDLFRPDGSPYRGVVQWDQAGHKSIERLPILS